MSPTRLIMASSLLLISCDTSTPPAPMGYIEIRLASTQQPSKQLLFGSTQLPAFRNGGILLHVNAGTSELKPEGWFQSTYCHVEVRANRVTSLTLEYPDEDAACVCARFKPNNPDEIPTCI